MTKLDLKHAKTKTYAVRGYNVDLTFVYDANGIYIEQKSLIEQMPDIRIAKNKFKHLNTKYSLTINRSEVKGNKQLLSMFAGTRQNQRRLNNIEGTIQILKRFELPLADKMIKTIEQRKDNIEKLQAKLFQNEPKPEPKLVARYSPRSGNHAPEDKKEIKPMIVDSTELKKMAKGKVKQAQSDKYKTKYDALLKSFEIKKHEFDVLENKHNKLRDKYNQVDNENNNLFKKLGRAEKDMEAYDDLKVKYGVLENDYKDLNKFYQEEHRELYNIKNASFGKRLASAFTGWGV